MEDVDLGVPDEAAGRGCHLSFDSLAGASIQGDYSIPVPVPVLEELVPGGEGSFLAWAFLPADLRDSLRLDTPC